jgi:hypothetical protein
MRREVYSIKGMVTKVPNTAMFIQGKSMPVRKIVSFPTGTSAGQIEYEEHHVRHTVVSYL